MLHLNYKPCNQTRSYLVAITVGIRYYTMRPMHQTDNGCKSRSKFIKVQIVGISTNKMTESSTTLLKFITYFGIRCSAQVSDPSGGCPGLSRQLKAESELLRNPTNPTNSYELLWILRSSIDSNYCRVYRGHFRPTAE
jgi:hypothetical protein